MVLIWWYHLATILEKFSFWRNAKLIISVIIFLSSFSFFQFSVTLHEENDLEWYWSSVAPRGLLRIVSHIPSLRASAYPMYGVLNVVDASLRSVGLSRYWDEFYVMRRSKHFHFLPPPPPKPGIWKLLPSNSNPPGPRLCSNALPKLIFLKKENSATVAFYSITRL